MGAEGWDRAVDVDGAAKGPRHVFEDPVRHTRTGGSREGMHEEWSDRHCACHLPDGACWWKVFVTGGFRAVLYDWDMP